MNWTLLCRKVSRSVSSPVDAPLLNPCSPLGAGINVQPNLKISLKNREIIGRLGLRGFQPEYQYQWCSLRGLPFICASFGSDRGLFARIASADRKKSSDNRQMFRDNCQVHSSNRTLSFAGLHSISGRFALEHRRRSQRVRCYQIDR